MIFLQPLKGIRSPYQRLRAADIQRLADFNALSASFYSRAKLAKMLPIL